MNRSSFALPKCLVPLVWVFLGLLATKAQAQTKSASATDSLAAQAQHLYGSSPANALVLIKSRISVFRAKQHTRSEIWALNLLAKYQLRSQNYDSARYYSNTALKLNNTTGKDSLRGNSWRMLALADHLQGNYAKAITEYQNAINTYPPQSKLNTALAYLNLGICQQQTSGYEQSIKNCLVACGIFQAINDDTDLANAYRSVALSFVSLDNYDKALYYNKRSLAIRQKLNDVAGISQSLNNIGFLFNENHQPDSAIAYLNKSLNMRRNAKDSSVLILPLQNIGSSWRIKKNLAKAEAYTLRSLRIARSYALNEDLARGELDLARIRHLQGRYAQALTSATTAQAMAKQLHLPELLMDSYAATRNIYLTTKDYPNVLRSDSLRNSIQDSLISVEKLKSINELDIQYQTVQKEKDIKALHLQNGLQRKIVVQQKWFIGILCIAAVMLLLLFIFAYRNYRTKTRANERINMLMQDLHHRVKNNLQILSAVFNMQLDSLSDETARNTLLENESRLTSMNLIHNKLYLDKTTTQIEMSDYISKLVAHIKALFGKNNVTLNLDIQPIKLEADKAVLIGLIINELTTNCFKYAFDDSDGEIYLSMQPGKSGSLHIILKDNGKGIATSKAKEASFGLKLVKLMVKQLNAKMTTDQTNGLEYRIEIDIS